MPGKAIVLGASGLVGKSVTNILARSLLYDDVLLLVRKKLDIQGPNLRQCIINFDALDEYRKELTGKAIFSCLGTTRSQTPDYKDYKKIDFDYPLQIAQAAVQQGVEQFHIISSIGADKNSGNSYLKLKGELEESLKTLPFKSIHIYRPSFLTGHRDRPRLLEQFLNPLMKVINPLLGGRLKKYRSIDAEIVAQAMVVRSAENLAGVFIYESDQIQEIK